MADVTCLEGVTPLSSSTKGWVANFKEARKDGREGAPPNDGVAVEKKKRRQCAKA